MATPKSGKPKSSGQPGNKRSSASSQTTTDHETIRQWAEQRGAHPAAVAGTGSDDDPGLLRIDFPGFSGEGELDEISWDEFFEKFDEQKLALVYQETTADGKKSNFNKLISRDTASERTPQSGGRSSSRRAGSGGSSEGKSSPSRGRSRKPGSSDKE